MENYPYPQGNKVSSATDVQETPLEALNKRRCYHVTQLQNINAAIEALEANPEINNIITLIAKANSNY